MRCRSISTGSRGHRRRAADGACGYAPRAGGPARSIRAPAPRRTGPVHRVRARASAADRVADGCARDRAARTARPRPRRVRRSRPIRRGLTRRAAGDLEPHHRPAGAHRPGRPCAARAGATAAQDAYDVAAEGILNAVKHSGERRAEVLLDVVATGAGPALRVRVRSSAPLSAGAELRPASHVRSLGATLRSTSEGAVLEALIRVDAPARDGSVVSAEHPV